MTRRMVTKTSFVIIGATALGLLNSPTVNAQGKPLTLIENGKSQYVIALASDAIPAEQTAANELQTYLKEISGVTLDIKNENEVPAKAAQIVVGAGPRAKSLVSKPVWDSLGLDGILIQTSGNSLVLAGTRPRGTLYAVYEFLEKSAGVRWWTPVASEVPKRTTLRIPTQTVSYTPAFSYREHYGTTVQQDPLFATRMRENGHYQTQDTKLGGHYSILGFCHTFWQLLPLEKYFKDHPKWYSDPANGNKPCTSASAMPDWRSTQLNLTNDEMRRELTKNALEWIRKNPEAGIISISQNDNDNYCRSEGDMAIIEREGAPSGALIHFVNQVAEDIEKEFPDFIVETLSYAYTQTPPLHIKPRKNVIVRFCTIGANFIEPLNSNSNQAFRNDINRWKAISPRLYAWDYVTNFYSSIWPHPNLYVLGPNLLYLSKNSITSVFDQGNAYSNSVGDFEPMRTWIIGKLLWNPNLDDNALIEEFMQGYYGAAAPHLMDYQKLVHSAFLKSGQRLSTYQGQPERGNNDYLNLNVVNQAWELFDEAAKTVANDPVLSKRVRIERLALDHVILLRYKQLQEEAATGKTATALPSDVKAFLEEFLAILKANKVEMMSEHMTLARYEPELRKRFEP